MLHVKGIQHLKESPKHPVVTLGNFDGVHWGHRELIEQTLRRAHSNSGTAIVYSFRPHPQIALTPENPIPLLTTYEEKAEIFQSLGIDLFIEEPFSREFSSSEPENFFQSVLVHRLSTEVLIVGYDFSFGKERRGHTQALEMFCKKSGIELIIVPPQRIDGEVISSSRIRETLLLGNIPHANQLLGSPFFYRGIVLKGDGKGRTLGFPTANIKVENKLQLPFGVYATRAFIKGNCYPSVTNIGIRPTFRHTEPSDVVVETHLLDVNLDLYGLMLQVEFISRLRDEIRFNSMDELSKQIAADAAQAKILLNK